MVFGPVIWCRVFAVIFAISTLPCSGSGCSCSCIDLMNIEHALACRRWSTFQSWPSQHSWCNDSFVKYQAVSKDSSREVCRMAERIRVRVIQSFVTFLAFWSCDNSQNHTLDGVTLLSAGDVLTLQFLHQPFWVWAVAYIFGVVAHIGLGQGPQLDSSPHLGCDPTFRLWLWLTFGLGQGRWVVAHS